MPAMIETKPEKKSVDADPLGFRAGYVAIVGRPNVGKSTLLNQMLEEKVSIVSGKPQTTRWQIRGIKSAPDYQIVFTDTPGYQNMHDSAINRYMNKEVVNALAHIDVALLVVEAVKWSQADGNIAHLLKGVSAPVILVINKLDRLKDPAALLPYIDDLKGKLAFTEAIPICARKRRDVNLLERKLVSFLPAGEQLFPAEQITDRSERFMAAEYIREKMMVKLGDELPYKVSVTIDEFRDEKLLLSIFATIWIERESHKSIIIGENGKALKSIGRDARKELERFFAKRVYLQTWIKLRKNWTEDLNALRDLGYK